MKRLPNLLALGLSLAFAAPAAAVVPPDRAAAVFAEARAICERDHAALWNHSLCGPILLVDPDDRSVVASQADAMGALKPAGGVFVGALPKADNIANSPTQFPAPPRPTPACQLLPQRSDHRPTS